MSLEALYKIYYRSDIPYSLKHACNQIIYKSDLFLAEKDTLTSMYILIFKIVIIIFYSYFSFVLNTYKVSINVPYFLDYSHYTEVIDG